MLPHTHDKLITPIFLNLLYSIESFPEVSASSFKDARNKMVPIKAKTSIYM